MSGRLRAVAVVVAALTVGRVALSQAQAPARPQATGPARRNVELSIVGAVDAELEDTVRELLGRLGIRLAAGTAQGMDEELARVEIDLSATSDARVLVIDARTGAVVLRRRVPRNPSAAIFRDEIAHAVDEAIQSELLVDQDRVAGAPAVPSPSPPAPEGATAAPAPPAPTEEPMPPPPPPPATPPAAPDQELRDVAPRLTRRRVPLALDVTTLAGAGPYAQRSYVVPRVEGGAIVAFRRWLLHPSVGMTVAYLPQFGPSSPGLSYHATVLALRAMPGIEVLHTSRLAVGFGAGGGVDMLTVTPAAGAQFPSSTIGSPTTRFDPILSAAITGHVAIAQGAAFTATATCDFDLVSRSYVEQDGPGQKPIFVPWLARPMLLAGFTFTALGEGVFAARGAR